MTPQIPLFFFFLNVAFCHAFFRPTIYIITDSQGKGAVERLGEGDQNIKKAQKQHSHARMKRQV